MNKSTTRTIWVNEDDAHYYSCHPAEDMTVEALERLVDYYAEDTQVAGILFCCAMQKALFNSKSREPLYGGYDPHGGPDQPFLKYINDVSSEIIPGNHGRNWVHNLWLLNIERGIDHLQVWLDRTRHHHGIQGWLTLRMNDSHGLKEYAQREAGLNEYDEWCLLCPSTYWKEHPELRRAPYRLERSWEGAYDYAQQAVRDHYLELIAEVCERYDFDGFELDWMRWGMNFKPGHERAGRAILTEFTREVKKHIDKAAERLGHPVKLGVRIPAEPRVAWSLGYDVPNWVRSGLVDQVVLGGFGGSANFDVPVEEWRLLTNNRVPLIVQTGRTFSTSPYGATGTLEHDDLQHAVSANAHHREADGVYLFNDCYRESGDRDRFKEVLQTIGALETLQRRPRCHSVAFAGMNAAGGPIGNVLPVPLIVPRIGYDYGRMEENISVSIFTGPVPESGTATLHLGFSSDTQELKAEDIEVRLNTAIVEPSDKPSDSMLKATIGRFNRGKSHDKQVLSYNIPLELIFEDSNMVEFIPPQVPGDLIWAEIHFDPAS